MDRSAARDTARLIATLIGEIMEDEVETALVAEKQTGGVWSKKLERAGGDIADLARAIAVIGRRSD